MSYDYYFNKWKETLRTLENLVFFDLDFQNNKAHDQARCHAAQRLARVLGGYMSVYNDVIDCLHNNLQVQKRGYLENIVDGIVKRIFELKQQLSKLEPSNYHFLSHGLINHKMIIQDVELNDLPKIITRPENVLQIIEQAKVNVAERKAEMKRMALEKEKEEMVDKGAWWDPEDTDAGKNAAVTDIYEVEEKLSEDTLERKAMVTMIQAHERTRQYIRESTHKKLKREMWEKELSGTRQPEARIELKERGARLLKDISRKYFELKRKKIENRKRDEILGLIPTKKFKEEIDTITSEQEYRKRKFKLFDSNQDECNEVRRKIKEEYFKRKGDELKEHYRDSVRDWFRKWFDEITVFYDIPKDENGGAVVILNENVPEPLEWWEQYKTYMESKNSKKNPQEEKQNKLAAKNEEIMKKKEEQMKKKQEEIMLRKLMKNPNMHPGYTYPESTTVDYLIQAIKKYNEDWYELDFCGSLDVKIKYVLNKETQNMLADVKLDVCKLVDDDMRKELKTLKKALKNDYLRNEEEMPEMKMRSRKKKKKLKGADIKICESFCKYLENLALNDIWKEYPKTKIEDFKGDPNFTGDDSRCDFKTGVPYGGETRNLWWEKCYEMCKGFQRILLVGPKASGRSILVYAMATINDAFLFELDITNLTEDVENNLQDIVNELAVCATTAQPAIIYLKHVDALYVKKKGKKGGNDDYQNIRKYLGKKLMKKIRKTDNVTIIGTCSDPWLTKSTQMLKQFPTVVMIPESSYSMAIQILNEWVTNNQAIPPDLNIQTLAYLLRHSRYTYLKETLAKFLTGDRRCKIVAHGLKAEEVYKFALENEDPYKADFEKYRKWYTDKTYWGRREKKDLEEQTQFKEMIKKYAAQKEKKSKSDPSSVSTSMTSLKFN